jgi:phage/plasmid-like protein (TIGR03299 family)
MHEVETMMYNRERGLPWHGLGNGVSGARTAKQAIVDAGLDWDVELRKMYTLSGKGNKIQVPGFFASTRVTDDKVLGVVKTRYVPFQNREAFAFTDDMVDSGEAKYDTAGSLRGGKVVFLSMLVPQHILVAGEDRHDMYILLRTSHDGSKAIGVYLTMIRAVCMNTVTLGVNSAEFQWSTPHVSTMEGKLAEARNTLQLSFTYADEFSKHVEQLMKTKVNDDRAVDILTTVLPARPKTDEKIDAIMECLRTSDKNGYHGTGWGVVNAITEYQQHWRDHIEPEATFMNVIDGEIRKWRNKASDLILSR